MRHSAALKKLYDAYGSHKNLILNEKSKIYINHWDGPIMVMAAGKMSFIPNGFPEFPTEEIIKVHSHLELYAGDLENHYRWIEPEEMILRHFERYSEHLIPYLIAEETRKMKLNEFCNASNNPSYQN